MYCYTCPSAANFNAQIQQVFFASGNISCSFCPSLNTGLNRWHMQTSAIQFLCHFRLLVPWKKRVSAMSSKLHGLHGSWFPIITGWSNGVWLASLSICDVECVSWAGLSWTPLSLSLQPFVRDHCTPFVSARVNIKYACTYTRPPPAICYQWVGSLIFLLHGGIEYNTHILR